MPTTRTEPVQDHGQRWFDQAGQHFHAGQIDQARAIQYGLLDLIKLIIFGADFPEAVRQAVGLRGFAMGKGRQPLSPSQQFSLEEVNRTVQCILNTFGLADQPPGGCEPMPAGVDQKDVEQIVQDVVRGLRSTRNR